MEEKNYNPIIPKIKAIIEEWGAVSTGELQLDCSPCYVSVGNLTSLVEKFNLHDVDIVTYDEKGNEIDSFSEPYENLSNETLEEIFNAVEEYDIDMQRTMNRCKDNNF